MKPKPDFVYRAPTPVKPKTGIESIDSEGMLAKWAPLLVGSVAIGIGVYAIKKLQESNATTAKVMDELKVMNQRISNMDSFIKSPTKNRAPAPQVPRKVEIPVPEPPITIINGDEYEEVEVTDDEAEETES